MTFLHCVLRGKWSDVWAFLKVARVSESMKLRTMAADTGCHPTQVTYLAQTSAVEKSFSYVSMFILTPTLDYKTLEYPNTLGPLGQTPHVWKNTIFNTFGPLGRPFMSEKHYVHWQCPLLEEGACRCHQFWLSRSRSRGLEKQVRQDWGASGQKQKAQFREQSQLSRSHFVNIWRNTSAGH